MTTMIECVGVAKRFGGVVALSDCDLRVERGSVAGLIGPNGSGKTTLFNVLSGFITPDAGSVRIGERDVTGLRPDAVFGLGLARTFQRPRVFGRLSVLESMFVSTRRVGPRWRELVGGPGSKSELGRAMDVLKFVGLDSVAGLLAGELSFGQRKLLELAYVLVSEPDVILLDEPAGGVNPTLANRIADQVRALNERGVTFLIVEHDMDFVASICDHITVLDSGKVLSIGTPAEIRADPLVIDAYLGGVDV